MTCLGLIKNKNYKVRRCKEQGKRFFCHHHSLQPLGWLLGVVITGGSIAGSIASILSYFENSRTSVAERKALTPAETNSPQSVLPPLVSPSPNESPTVAPTPSPTPAVGLPSQKQLTKKTETASDHINRARVLLGREQLDAALVECNKALRLDRNNRAAIDLRNSINELHKLQKQQQ